MFEKLFSNSYFLYITGSIFNYTFQPINCFAGQSLI
jgi:hypothetical protein